MPRTKLAERFSKPKQPEPAPAIDHIKVLFQHYKSFRHMSYEQLGPLVNMEPGGAKNKMFRGSEKFQFGEMRDWCRALDIPDDEFFRAVELTWKRK